MKFRKAICIAAALCILCAACPMAAADGYGTAVMSIRYRLTVTIQITDLSLMPSLTETCGRELSLFASSFLRSLMRRSSLYRTDAL